MIDCDRDPSHQQIPVHRTVIDPQSRVHDQSAGGSCTVQILCPVGMLRNLVPVVADRHFSLIARLLPVQILIIHSQHDLVRDHPFFHQVKCSRVSHLMDDDPCLVK